MPSDAFERWLAALERRHLAELGFAEVRRGLQALSSVYVERRGRLGGGGALDGRGKRAAFALYYGPRHFLLLRAIVRGLRAAEPPLARLLDLGCGTGVAGAAWALEAAPPRPSLLAVDQSGWALDEARWTLARLGLPARVARGDAGEARLPDAPAGVVLAFTLNELSPAHRGKLLPRLVEAGRSGTRVLVVEPLARRALPWWPEWAAAFCGAGGREDEWRLEAELPETQALLARAARLDGRELSGRSLWLDQNSSRRPRPTARGG